MLDKKFEPNTLKQDEYFCGLLGSLISTNPEKLGVYIGIESFDDLFNRFVTAKYEEVKYLHKANLVIYKTSDIGIGFNNVVSTSHLKELISLGLTSLDLPVSLEWGYGNIFARTELSHIDSKLVLTDDTYVVAHKDTLNIYMVKIGKFTNPNRLFDRPKLNGVLTSFGKVSTLEGLNSVWLVDKMDTCINESF